MLLLFINYSTTSTYSEPDLVITFPTNTTDVIDAIRGAIGREVTFYLVTYSGCSVCGLDPVTDTSTDPFCTTCGGKYWVPVYSGYTTSGHITWGKVDNLNWVTGGKFFTGDCRLQVKYSTEMITVLEDTEYVEVDGMKMRIDSKDYRGVPNINRIVLSLSEED